MQQAERTTPPTAPPGKVFKKCKSATFHIDGATYTIAVPGSEPGSSRRSRSKLEQGSMTVVRRTGGKRSPARTDTGENVDEEGAAALDAVDLSSDNLPPVDTPDACDKAALRLRSLLIQLRRGEVSADVLQRNLRYAADVLEAVYIDETKPPELDAPEERIESGASTPPPGGSRTTGGTTVTTLGELNRLMQKRRLRKPVWATNRRLADEDDELSEVQPDAVPPEVREWLASTFTRQLATTRRKNDEKPKFRSVAHAIRAGIFVDRMYRRVGHATLMQFPAEVVRVLKTLDEWTFDVFALGDVAGSQPVKYIGYDLLNRYGIIHKFKVPPAVLEQFLARVEDGYQRYLNPYHNNLHAADVCQTVHYMLCQTGLMNWLSDLEIFATLVAALIHDFEHTGTTNNFHVQSGSDTALLYNDRAVLENHHISAAFRLMRDESECNILQNLSREEFREFRNLIIDMVLATDMSYHFQQLKTMRGLLSLATGGGGGDGNSGTASPAGPSAIDKSKALSLVLHSCDISHPAKQWKTHHRWTTLLLEEFFRQGDRERELGLPFSPLCDRNNTLVAESQIGFIDFIVEPSMGVCGDMLEIVLSSGAGGPPQDLIKPWIRHLAENKKVWKDQAAKDAEVRAQKQREKEAAEAAAAGPAEE